MCAPKWQAGVLEETKEEIYGWSETGQEASVREVDAEDGIRCRQMIGCDHP